MRALRTLASALIPLAIASCAAPNRSTSFEAAPGEYARAFEAAKAELREAGFELDRVDARAGVITTRPSASAGFFTPWTTHEQTLGAEWDGTMNAERRIVTIHFSGAGAPVGASAGSSPDLREAGGSTVAEVHVEVRRLYRPGRTPESAAVRLTTQFRDPEWEAAGLQPAVVGPYGSDPDLARALASRIARRAGSSEQPIQTP
ncbi:MAG: hypothetical protein IBJ10_01645 [Phycisphaerales bacterium]|nr:hypothetical protein [Phycisphaerales bacterium]